MPYGRDHANPPAGTEPVWESPRTRELTVRACFDCHSNASRWPWYSNVAPASWLVQRDVAEGREAVNYTDWAHPPEEAAEAVSEGSMPPRPYLLLHPEARLSAAERAELIRGLEATFGRPARRQDREGRDH